METVRVELGRRAYEIYIGYDIFRACLARLGEATNERRIFLLSDSQVFQLHGLRLLELFNEEGWQVASHVIPPGEASKSWDEAGAILDQLAGENFSRHTPLAALGGGVVGDLGAFTAALYRRGIPLIQIPASLLAQVDSSVGGKAAVNHPAGKNMIGTFYQPRAVWTDLSLLATLPDAEWRSGLAEVLKYALLGDKELFLFLEKEKAAVKSRDQGIMPGIIARCCRIKAELVAADERDEGRRNILNLGHTIGHGLEAATSFSRYRHGEAVAVGLCGAFSLACRLGMVSREMVRRVETLLEYWQLPTRFPHVLLDMVYEKMRHDKKMQGSQPVFVLPDALGSVTVKKGIEEAVIIRTLEEIAQ